jgi:RNase H-fold protein (predicted Holliday junction resolvase)
MAILGIDPGTRKCGYAVVETIGGVPLDLGIEPTDRLAERVRTLVASYAPTAIALGRGTHSAFVQGLIAGYGIPIALVDEYETTLLARKRYFAAHPPAWWLRLVPRGMLLPPRPIDDFAAVLIAERLLALREN